MGTYVIVEGSPHEKKGQADRPRRRSLRVVNRLRKSPPNLCIVVYDANRLGVDIKWYGMVWYGTVWYWTVQNDMYYIQHATYQTHDVPPVVESRRE